MDLIFERRELKILDDIMPEMTKRNEHDLMQDAEVGWAGKIAKFCIGSKPVKRNASAVNKEKLAKIEK